MVLDGLHGLYGLKYDSANARELPLYLCSYKLVGSTTEQSLAPLLVLLLDGMVGGAFADVLILLRLAFEAVKDRSDHLLA